MLISDWSSDVCSSDLLVRFNERIRLAGRLIEDQPLAALLAEVLDANGDDEISFFEATTAAAFLAFSRTPADACVIEVGLGGRLDATNVIPAPAACGISQLGVDHQAFLGDTIEQIAAEKAGTAKPGVPIIMSRNARGGQKVVSEEENGRGGAQVIRGVAWDAAVYEGHLHYRDGKGLLELQLPRLPGAHSSEERRVGQECVSPC